MDRVGHKSRQPHHPKRKAGLLSRTAGHVVVPVAVTLAGLALGVAVGVFSLHALADDRPERHVRRGHAEPIPQPRTSTQNAEPAIATSDDDRPRTEAPIEFITSRGRQCQRRRRRIVCDGPKRVARPHGPAAALANELGLNSGARRLAHDLMWEPPRREWLAAIAPGRPTPARLQWPVEGGNLWRGFGYVRQRRRVRHRPHLGIDIGAPDGTPIKSVADGIVTYSDNGVSGYGNLLMILHRDGSLAMYAHNRATFVFAGQQVSAGEVVAEVGHTGLARGPHLHFELRTRGRPRNPMRRLRAPDRRVRSSDLYL